MQSIHDWRISLTYCIVILFFHKKNLHAKISFDKKVSWNKYLSICNFAIDLFSIGRNASKAIEILFSINITKLHIYFNCHLPTCLHQLYTLSRLIYHLCTLTSNEITNYTLLKTSVLVHFISFIHLIKHHKKRVHRHSFSYFKINQEFRLRFLNLQYVHLHG